MNPLELYQLKRFCDVHGLDYQLIDNALSYHENMALLSAFVPADVEEIAEEYGRSYEEWEEALSLGDLYGVTEQLKAKAETPLLMFNCIVWFSCKRLRVVRTYLKPYSKNVEFQSKRYLIIKGQITTIQEICDFLKQRINCKVLGFNKQYEPTWTFLPKHGWIKNLTVH